MNDIEVWRKKEEEKTSPTKRELGGAAAAGGIVNDIKVSWRKKEEDRALKNSLFPAGIRERLNLVHEDSFTDSAVLAEDTDAAKVERVGSGAFQLLSSASPVDHDKKQGEESTEGNKDKGKVDKTPEIKNNRRISFRDMMSKPSSRSSIGYGSSFRGSIRSNFRSNTSSSSKKSTMKSKPHQIIKGRNAKYWIKHFIFILGTDKVFLFNTDKVIESETYSDILQVNHWSIFESSSTSIRKLG